MVVVLCTGNGEVLLTNTNAKEGIGRRAVLYPSGGAKWTLALEGVECGEVVLEPYTQILPVDGCVEAAMVWPFSKGLILDDTSRLSAVQEIVRASVELLVSNGWRLPDRAECIETSEKGSLRSDYGTGEVLGGE